ncbi:MAG TPA: hypothetical protein VN818_09795 [Gammaproteobacteria bacterium]|nr:hypothetical protein [Gammaproteobacteria bacterium]
MIATDNIRACAPVAAALMLAGCYSVRYDHVVLSGQNIEATEVARPYGGNGFGVGKGEIPVRYTLEQPDASLAFQVDANYGLSIDISSSVPIVAVSSTMGQVVRKSPLEYWVDWATQGPDSQAGETLEIRIELQDRADPIVVSGVIEKWGTFYHPADL